MSPSGVSVAKDSLGGLPSAESARSGGAADLPVVPNEHYRTEEEYEHAVADALRQEYLAILDAGLILQIDDPRLVTYYMMNPHLSVKDCRTWAAKRVEAINYSIRGIPPEKIRFHTCYSIDVGARFHEMEPKDIVDILLRIDAGAYSFEAANALPSGRNETSSQMASRERLA